MKILTFTHLFPNAMQPVWGIFVYQRTRHLAEDGNQVKVVAPVPYIPRWFPSKERERYKHIPRSETVGGLGVDHPRYALVPKIAMPFHGILLFLGCWRQVAKLHREERFDCIDSHWIYPDGFAAVLLGKMLGIPVFCSARGTDANVYPAFRLVRPLIQWTLREAAGVIAVSQALKEVIAGLGVSRENVGVIGNGVDLQRFEMLNRQTAREKLGLPREGQLLLAVGTLNEHKNHALLISAFAQLAPRWPKLQLHIVGEGHLRASLEGLVKGYGLQDRVLLPGSRPNEELYLWYNAADLSCLSSSREGWPNVLLESLACGTPVVATRVGGVGEVITLSELGVVVETTAQAFSEGLEKGLRTNWERDALRKYAQSRTWHEVAKEVETFLSERIPAARR